MATRARKSKKSTSTHRLFCGHPRRVSSPAGKGGSSLAGEVLDDCCQE